jgi:voltage-gated potassium channel
MVRRFTVLLCGLVILIFASPIADRLHHGPPGLVSRLLILACFSLMLLSALFAISCSHRHLVVASILSIPSIVLQSAHAVRPSDLVGAWGDAFTVLYLWYIISLVIQALFQKRTVTADTICASLCVYLLLGLCWAYIYTFVEYQLPGSFSISDVHMSVPGELNVSGSHMGFAVYYSFVTLSTLGYGDVLPVNSISRAFSYSEAIAGQIYLAILVARLVGLHISQTLVRHEEKK